MGQIRRNLHFNEHGPAKHNRLRFNELVAEAKSKKKTEDMCLLLYSLDPPC